jgi:hypothetical protein
MAFAERAVALSAKSFFVAAIQTFANRRQNVDKSLLHFYVDSHLRHNGISSWTN